MNMPRTTLAFLSAFIAFHAGGVVPVRGASLGTCELSITSPSDDAEVDPFTSVSGTISSETAAVAGSNVWVIIHPDNSWYWVQGMAQASKGAWRANTQFGDPDTRPGFHFEIRAFAAPTIPIKNGDKLSSFPMAACSSKLVNVRRK